MKTTILYMFGVLMLLGNSSCNAQPKNDNKASLADTEKIEVYYFHFTRRCITCNAVESETKKALAEYYPEKMSKGDISFISLNLDDESSKAAAQKAQASGQALIILKGTTRIDLTTQGFMYAKNTPEKLREAVKTSIDPLIAVN